LTEALLQAASARRRPRKTGSPDRAGVAREDPSRSADDGDSQRHQGAQEKLGASCDWELGLEGAQWTAGEAGAPGRGQAGVAVAADQLLQRAQAAGNEASTEPPLQPPPLDARPPAVDISANTGDVGTGRSKAPDSAAEDGQETPKSKQVKRPIPGRQKHIAACRVEILKTFPDVTVASYSAVSVLSNAIVYVNEDLGTKFNLW